MARAGVDIAREREKKFREWVSDGTTRNGRSRPLSGCWRMETSEGTKSDWERFSKILGPANTPFPPSGRIYLKPTRKAS